MFKKFLTTLLITVLLSLGVKPATANTVVEKVARSGNLVVGTPFNLVPYSFKNSSGELGGYSIDVVKLIQQQLETELDKSIQLDFVEVNTISDAISKIATGEIDVVCNTIFTWERDQYVDYTIRYIQSDIRLLIPKGKMSGDSFAGKKIGIPNQPFVSSAVSLFQPDATLVDFETIEDGLKALKEGKIDALAGDAIILNGDAQRLQMNDVEIFPKGIQGYGNYGVACIVAENNSTFLNVANFAIARMMEGYLVGNEEMTKKITPWFGKDGIITIVPEERLKEFFRETINNHEQIPFEKPTGR